jgi:hypothetical protein
MLRPSARHARGAYRTGNRGNDREIMCSLVRTNGIGVNWIFVRKLGWGRRSRRRSTAPYLEALSLQDIARLRY